MNKNTKQIEDKKLDRIVYFGVLFFAIILFVIIGGLITIDFTSRDSKDTLVENDKEEINPQVENLTINDKLSYIPVETGAKNINIDGKLVALPEGYFIEKAFFGRISENYICKIFDITKSDSCDIYYIGNLNSDKNYYLSTNGPIVFTQYSDDFENQKEATLFENGSILISQETFILDEGILDTDEDDIETTVIAQSYICEESLCVSSGIYDLINKDSNSNDVVEFESFITNLILN
ncbi:MAG: hypothetical protein Q9M91_04815 [Candidatus Dojkabacteria bacterium]|nr:hypothetical protein [Candidatus Dojkabacteria bacterium]MDQ7021130.1 hypothetical protein [Candidatus Dojkabacteria bacterium]